MKIATDQLDDSYKLPKEMWLTILGFANLHTLRNTLFVNKYLSTLSRSKIIEKLKDKIFYAVALDNALSKYYLFTNLKTAEAYLDELYEHKTKPAILNVRWNNATFPKFNDFTFYAEKYSSWYRDGNGPVFHKTKCALVDGSCLQIVDNSSVYKFR